MLSDVEILEEMENGNITITPFNRENLGANSYDLTLGNWFVPLLGYKFNEPVFGNFFFVPDKSWVTIPHGTLLAMTREVAGSRWDIVPLVKTRSSIRRGGIDICASAGLGDIGYINHWTVELTSYVSDGLVGYDEPCLQVGSRFAQIVFERAGKPARKPYAGQYNTKDWPLCMIPKQQRGNYSTLTFDPNNFVTMQKEPSRMTP